MALSLLSRLVLLAVAAIFGAAIHIGRACPERAPRRAGHAAPRVILEKTYSGGETGVPANRVDPGSRLLDAQTGRLDILPLPRVSSLTRASLSPWEDRGRRQVVGFESDDSTFAMVRMILPGGELLNRVDFANYAVPASAQCWFPGTSARVIYAGGDGRIYRLDFETTRPNGGVAVVPDVRPRALTWRAATPEAGAACVLDLSWPEDVRLGGRLLATLCFKGPAGGPGSDFQIWWLELDRDGTSIIAAGPLLQPERAGEVRARRLPTLVRDVDGAPSLAYLARVPRQAGRQLRVVPIRFGPGSGVPLAREAEARILARGCLLADLAVSPDGRWVTVVRPDGPTIRAERLPVGDDLALVAGSPRDGTSGADPPPRGCRRFHRNGLPGGSVPSASRTWK